MKFRLRHILLPAGIALVFASFLFFGREHAIFYLMLLAGLIIATLSFLIILFKDGWKSRIVWLLIVIVSVLVERSAEHWLIGRSYKIMIDRHEALFAEANRLFASKRGTIYYTKDGSQDLMQFTGDERKTIRRLLNETPVYLIMRDSLSVNYITFGLLDVHLGVYYIYSDRVPGEPYRFIKPHWYY